MFRISSYKQDTLSVDKRFLLEYMPKAPEGFIKAYLLGLAFCSSEKSVEELQNLLDLDEREFLSAFSYWQERGLVKISLDPTVIEFLDTPPLRQAIVKFDKEKYHDFNLQLHALMQDRVITLNEYNEYYSVIELGCFDSNALLYLVSFCIKAKGEKVRHQYITTIAWDLVGKGIKSAEKVKAYLLETGLLDDELKEVFKALRLRTTINEQDRFLYSEWKALGFSKSTIVFVAEKLRFSSLKLLDEKLRFYTQKNLTSKKAIEGYLLELETLLELAKEFLKIIGIRETYSWSLENYISPWLSLGFSKDALLKIAAVCTALPYYQRGLQNIAEKIIEPLAKENAFTVDEIGKKLPQLLAQKTSVIKKRGDKLIEKDLSPDELDKQSQKLTDDDL